MLGTSTHKSAIIKTAYDWFYGITGTDAITAGTQQLGQNFPNPSSQVTTIPVSGLTSDMTLIVIDQLGRQIYSQPVSRNTTMIELNTSSLVNGIYFYRLQSASNNIGTKSMQVIH